MEEGRVMGVASQAVGRGGGGVVSSCDFFLCFLSLGCELQSRREEPVEEQPSERRG